MKKHQSRNHLLLWLSVVMLATLLFTFIIIIQDSQNNSVQSANAPGTAAALSVTFIDVGQADSALVTLSTGEVMLIDAAESSDTGGICNELDERGITQIDVLISTHPHNDHIGGMQSIIESYNVGRIYMPDMASDSNTYEKMMNAIEKNGIPVTEAYAGVSFSFGSASCVIVSPGKNDDKDANNESVVLWLDYDDTEFLFTGDMESWAENNLVDGGYNIEADVLKVAHHGSSSGTTEEFLRAVSPNYAVISCGDGNDYGHPHRETLDILNLFQIQSFRTDLDGDVHFISDGKALTVETEN